MTWPGVPQGFRCYQWPPVMRLGVSRMETEGHVFLIPIFESKRHEEDCVYNDAGDDSEVNLVEDEIYYDIQNIEEIKVNHFNYQTCMT